jgi:hypothetical protein
MTIFVDADACPVVIKDILIRAAERTRTKTLFVANQYIKLPPSQHVSAYQVASGFDVADNYIVNQVESGDLVITSDIPLAAEVIEKGALALSSRGQLFTSSNIKQRLQMRDFMETMRSSGIQSKGPAALSHSDRQQFANQLDSWLAKQS